MPLQTHGPERLREFMLPAMVINGLSLEDALRKLNAAYVDACEKSGEVPLPLTFSIPPPGSPAKLTLHLAAGNFNSTVRLLATISGMKAIRDGREFRFEPLAGERKQMTREFQVPPGFNTLLNQLALGSSSPDPDPSGVTFQMPEDECLKVLGLDLDPSTKVALDHRGKLTVETSSAADAAAISELAKVLTEQRPVQLKFTPKILEIPAGSDWTPPDLSQMTNNEAEMFVRKAAELNGVELQSLPSASAKSGNASSIEFLDSIRYPSDEPGGDDQFRDIGIVLKVQADFLGFGQELALDFTDTTADFDPSTGKPTFNKRAAMTDSGFSSDGGTRLMVQTRPDGSKTIVLLTATMIDATGRPVR